MHAVADLFLRNDRGSVHSDRIRTRPAVVLAALLRQLDPQADHRSFSVQLSP